MVGAEDADGFSISGTGAMSEARQHTMKTVMHGYTLHALCNDCYLFKNFLVPDLTQIPERDTLMEKQFAIYQTINITPKDSRKNMQTTRRGNRKDYLYVRIQKSPYSEKLGQTSINSHMNKYYSSLITAKSSANSLISNETTFSHERVSW